MTWRYLSPVKYSLGMEGESGSDNSLMVRLLGPIDVCLSGVSAPISQPGLRVLLAMLALSANQVVSVGALIDALWQEEASRQREKNLHVQVHQLRRRLAELEPGRGSSRIVTAPPGYLLELGPDELDVRAFAALTRQGRQAAARDPEAAATVLREALSLWRGPALGDVADACPRLAAEAAGLEEQRLAVLEDQGDADLATGGHADLAAHLPGLIAQSPLREHLRAQLMLALYRCGRQGDALAAYQQARQLLNDELGLDPGPQLQALQRQILVADPALDFAPGPRPNGTGSDSTRPDSTGPNGGRPAAAPGADQGASPAEPAANDDHGPAGAAAESATEAVTPRQLPAKVRHFAGRDAELLELDSMLGAPDSADSETVMVITGTAGVGKTALAVHWAHRAACHFPDGQLHVNLRGYDPSGVPVTAAEATRLLLNGLGVSREQIPDTQEAQAGLYRTLMADRRMLIVLDNARDSDQVRPLLPGGPGCVVLVTSRSSLSGLIATEAAGPVPLDLLAEQDAQAMLAARLGADRTGSDPAAVRQIIRLCARLPLALAITAARAEAGPGLSLAALADELAVEQDRLDALDTGDQATSIRAVFSWSYRKLGEPAARMFRLLGVHAGPDISLAAAASLAGLRRPETRRALAELAAAGLLIEHGAGRYVLHDLLRAYATEQASLAAGEHPTAVSRLVDHYLQTAHAATLLLAPLGHPIVLDPPLTGVTPERPGCREDALAWFRAELQVLLAIVRLADTTGLDAAAWQLPWTLRSFLDGQGLWQDWAAVNDIALAAAGRLQDHNGLGWTHHRMAQVCSLAGNIDDGLAHNEQALDHFGRAGNLPGQGSAHLGMCISLGRKGDHGAALHHGEQALGIFRTAGDQTGEAYMLHLVGLEQARLGNGEQGREHCTQAVELYGDLGDMGGMADAWHSLGTVHQQLGEHVEAIASFQQSLMLSAELGDLWGQAYCLIAVGDTHDRDGDVAGARETWQQALEMLGDLQHPDADRIRTRLHETADLPDGPAGPDGTGQHAQASALTR
jgi:DNA-binding SARP family transcriptional activator